MPLSFQRSFKRRPSTKINRKKHGAAPPSEASIRRLSDPPRATKYPLSLLIGCGVLIVLGVVLIVSGGLLGLPWRQVANATTPAASAAPTIETAIGAPVGPLGTAPPTTRPSPSPTAAAPTVTLTEAPSAASAPFNPWSAQIPEAACIRTDLPQKGTVVGVVDGDTIRVRLEADARIYSVRYIGAQSPQNGQYYGAISTGKNTELVLYKQAMLVRDLTDIDEQGTLLRYVMVGGKFVNYELIAGGYAQAISSPPDTACLSSFREAQHKAQAGNLGLWSAPRYLIPFSPTP